MQFLKHWEKGDVTRVSDVIIVVSVQLEEEEEKYLV